MKITCGPNGTPRFMMNNFFNIELPSLNFNASIERIVNILAQTPNRKCFDNVQRRQND